MTRNQYIGTLTAIILGIAGFAFAQEDYYGQQAETQAASTAIGTATRASMNEFMSELFSSFDQSQHASNPAARQAAPREHAALMAQMHRTFKQQQRATGLKNGCLMQAVTPGTSVNSNPADKTNENSRPSEGDPAAPQNQVEYGGGS